MSQVLADKRYTDLYAAGENTGEAAPTQRKGKNTVLVVDDDSAVRDALYHALASEFDVVLAASAVDALAEMRRSAYHTVITDLRMPGMDGLEFLSNLRAIDPDVPAILLTGYGTLDSATQAIRLGVTAYVSKPFKVAELRSLVAESCRRDEQRRLDKASAEHFRKQAATAESSRLERNIYAGILHDLNGPLTFLTGMSELLRDEMALSVNVTPTHLQDWRDRTEQLWRQASYCGELSQRSVRYIRGSRSSESAELPRVLEDLIQILRAHPACRGNNLIVRPAAAGLRTRMSSPDLLRVLVNLGVNALQASDQPHRVEIDTWSLQEPVDLLALNQRAPGILIGQETFLNRTPLVAVAVRDNGPGISPEILPRLFTSIVSTKDDRSGTGLGLTVVRRAVVEAGGALHLRTQPGRGTSFTLFLPG